MNKFGTREWAEVNKNILIGCEHNCRYCYARYNAIHRFKKVNNENDWWTKPLLDEKSVRETPRKLRGRIMYPTQHDITPDFLDYHIAYLRGWLQVGNEILIVSKPHFECVKRICDEFQEFKDQITFRFTIGSPSNEVLLFWEPNAPGFEERVKSLEYAFEQGYKTSVSSEPVLDEDIALLVHSVLPYINDSIWIGKMNFINPRVDRSGWSIVEQRYLDKVLRASTDEFIKDLYEEFKCNPKVKWKESVKKVLGLPDEEGVA
jgi:hypothetical protein